MARFTASLHVPVWVEAPDGTDPTEMVTTLIAQAAESNAPGILVDKYVVVDGPNGERLHVSFGESGYGRARIVNVRPARPGPEFGEGWPVRLKEDPAAVAVVVRLVDWFGDRGWMYDIKDRESGRVYKYWENELEAAEETTP